MRPGRVKRTAFLLTSLLFAIPAFADSVSLTGTLASDPNDALLISFSLSAPGSVTMRSFGFGGGTNGAGTVIAPGGFDTYFSLFTGTGPSATFLASNDDEFFGSGDSLLTQALGIGGYTLAVSLFDNMSFAENLGTGTLGDGFIGLGIDAGQTYDYAVDLVFDPGTLTVTDVHRLSDSVAPVPEPSGAWLLGTVAFGVLLFGKLRRTAAAG